MARTILAILLASAAHEFEPGHHTMAVISLPRHVRRADGEPPRPRHLFGQASNPAGAKRQCAELAGKPFAQAGDGLLERWLRAQGRRRAGTAVPKRTQVAAQNQPLGRLEPAVRSTARVARKRRKSRRKEDVAPAYIRPLL